MDINTAPKRGRPARLSRECILDTATGLLQQQPVEALTMTLVAKELGVTTMSLYKYFPNREALLNAVAEHAFAEFAPPPMHDDWRASLLAWLQTMQNYLEQNPAVTRVIGWEGRISSAWIKVLEPVLGLLRRQGLEGPQLAFAFNWFMSSAMGLLLLETYQPGNRQQIPLAALDSLNEASRDNLLALLPHQGKVDRYQVLAFGFEQLLEGVDQLLTAPAQQHQRQ